MPGDPAEWSSQEPTPLRSISQLSNPRNIMPVLESLCRRLDETEDYILSISHAYERSRRMLNAVLDITRRERLRRNEGLNDVKDRIGHLHEEVMRHAISVAYGQDWGTLVNIMGFTDAVSFVCKWPWQIPGEARGGKNSLDEEILQRTP